MRYCGRSDTLGYSGSIECAITEPELWNVTTTTIMTSLKHYTKWCGAVLVACLHALCVCVWEREREREREREKAHSRCLALAIMFEEDGLFFSDAPYLPPPIPVCCWNRKWVWGSFQLLCCGSGSHTTRGTRMLLRVCSWARLRAYFLLQCFLALDLRRFSYT